MNDAGETIRDHLARALDDPTSHWNLGGFGAVAAFGHAVGEPVGRLGRFGRLTPRGALILDPTDELVMVAYETGFAGGWSHCVALCLPAASALVPGPEVVTQRGPDAGAARREDSDALLFDLGVGIPQGWAGLRTRDPDLVARLSAACGTSAFAPDSPVPRLLAERRTDVVMGTPLGRIEVFGGPHVPVPGGPRAFVAPQVLRARRTHAATAPIPPGLIPCANLHPPHPCRDAEGRPSPFDAGAHAAFQAVLARWGDPRLFALKLRLAAGEAMPRGADRAARTVARVVAAQVACRAEAGPEPGIGQMAGKMVLASYRDGEKTIRDTTP
ncbi:DUF6925 family protein [Methylobacterium sp. J-090]|uniref:DUF6925 family protein n=1 Tax=Methylobacterium sp. J-090 TaxID=2836666 RepID=UPI001FBBB7EE|nr:hypothetical protein [Methylobacterium sp. J-090]MCJ2083058.1 hypothetical protein [Methylobacterium sp. J-090]